MIVLLLDQLIYCTKKQKKITWEIPKPPFFLTFWKHLESAKIPFLSKVFFLVARNMQIWPFDLFICVLSAEQIRIILVLVWPHLGFKRSLIFRMTLSFTHHYLWGLWVVLFLTPARCSLVMSLNVGQPKLKIF